MKQAAKKQLLNAQKVDGAGNPQGAMERYRGYLRTA